MGSKLPCRQDTEVIKKFFLLVICFLFFDFCLFAKGRKEETEEVPLNNEWLLCITKFDFSGVSPTRRIAAEVIVDDLLDKLKNISYRLRISPEYAY